VFHKLGITDTGTGNYVIVVWLGGGMKKLYIVLALVLLSNISFASNSGWVFWEESFTVFKEHKTGSIRIWTIMDSYETLAECNKERKGVTAYEASEHEKLKKKGQIEDYERGKYSIKITETDPSVSFTRLSYYCLPGTLDPRGKVYIKETE
jgi:hypothetical protein